MTRKARAVGDLVICLTVILVMFIVLFYGIKLYSDIGHAVSKERIARKYILSMETKGYLSYEEMTELTQELTEMGVTNISFEGTTLTPAGYGQPVILSITGKISISAKYGISGNWTWIGGENQVDFKIRQESTAKY